MGAGQWATQFSILWRQQLGSFCCSSCLPCYLPQSSSKCPDVHHQANTLCLPNIICFPRPHNCKISTLGPLVKGIFGELLKISRCLIIFMALEVSWERNSLDHFLCPAELLFNNSGAQRDFLARPLGPDYSPCRMTEVSPLGSPQSRVVLSNICPLVRTPHLEVVKLIKPCPPST